MTVALNVQLSVPVVTSIVTIVMIISVADVTIVRIALNPTVGVMNATTAVTVSKQSVTVVTDAPTVQPFALTVMKSALTAQTLIFVAVVTDVLTASVEKSCSAVIVKPVTTVPIMCVLVEQDALLVQ